MTVISLAAAREERTPHWAGICVCIGCRHEFAGIGPIGQEWIECEACHEPKAHAKHPFAGAIGDTAYQCKCGCEAMTAYFRQRDRHFFFRCMGCGTDHTAAIFGDAS